MGSTEHHRPVLDVTRDFRDGQGVMLALRDIPLLGVIPAGYPSDQEQQSDRCLSIDEDALQLPKNARTFALEVRGDSMIDAHIVAGDVVIMELRDPTHRDIVAPLIDGETTLKRFLVHKGKPFLRRREFQISRPHSGSRTGDPRGVSGALEGGQTPPMRSDRDDCPFRC